MEGRKFAAAMEMGLVGKGLIGATICRIKKQQRQQGGWQWLGDLRKPEYADEVAREFSRFAAGRCASGDAEPAILQLQLCRVSEQRHARGRVCGFSPHVVHL